MNDPALITLKQKVEADPGNILFRFSLGQALFSQGCYREACDHLEACIKARPDWMMAYILYGKALLACDAKQPARKALTQALELARQQNHEGPEMEVKSLIESL